MKVLQPLFSFFNVKKSIFSRLFFILLSITIISIIIIISIWTTNVYNIIRDLSQYYITDIVRNANSKFENNLYSLRSNLEIISGNKDVKTFAASPEKIDKSTVQNYLSDSFSLISTDVTGIAIITPNDIRAIGSYFPENSSSTDWYDEIIHADGNIVFLTRSRTSEKSLSEKISIGKAIIVNNHPCGAVVFDVKESVIIKYFGISHMNGLLRTVLASPDADIIFSNEQDISFDKLSGMIKNIKEDSSYDSLLTINLDGEEYFVLAKKFSSSPDWLNITFCPTKKLYSSYNQLIRLLMMIMLLVILITVLLASVSFSSTNKSFHQLSDYIDMIDLNNINKIKSFTPTSNDTEIGMISEKVNHMVNTISDQLQTINDLEEKKRIDEIQILKAQINPHLIYNTLNMIQTSAEYQKNTNISSIAKSLAMLLKYSVTDTDKLVTLQNEFDYIQHYVTIMQNKFINDITLTIMAEDAVRDCMVLKMVLQPIVENSIKHGFTDKPDQHIIIKAYQDNDKILIKITDNGLGISTEQLPKLLQPSNEGGSHLGLNNVNRRLKLTFGSEYGISISSIPAAQTTVCIEIPFIHNMERGETSE